jgi:Secretion system C-terminal sorting domain
MKNKLFLIALIYLCSHINAYSQTKITQYRYWFDQNFSTNIIAPLSNPSPDAELMKSFSTSDLKQGLHSINFQFQDDKQRWSPLISSFFYLTPKLTAYEYWFDADYANKKSEAFSPIDKNQELTLQLNTNLLSPGLHSINFRFRDELGIWSAITTDYFNKVDKIVAYRYWFNSEFEARVEAKVTPTIDYMLNMDIKTNSYTVDDTLHFQFQSEKGIWSSVVSEILKPGNLIQNGDFELGNVGFTSEMKYLATSDFKSGIYTIGTSATQFQNNFSNCNSNHTPNGKLMFIGNGSETTDSKVWSQTVAVKPNTDYTLSMWYANLSDFSDKQKLQFQVNNTLIGQNTTGPPNLCEWGNLKTIWNSGTNTTAKIEIINHSNAFIGNDFAIDDIYMTPVIVCPFTEMSILNLTPSINQTSYNVLQGATVHHYFWLKDENQQAISGRVINYEIGGKTGIFRSAPSDPKGLVDLAINLDGNDKESQSDDLITANNTVFVKFVGTEKNCSNKISVNDFKSFGIGVSKFQGKKPRHGFYVKGGPIFWTPGVDFYYQDLEDGSGNSGYGLKVSNDLTLDVLKGKVNDDKTVELNKTFFDKDLKAELSTYLLLDNAHYDSYKDPLFVIYLLLGGGALENVSSFIPVNHYIKIALQHLLKADNYKIYDSTMDYGISNAATLSIELGLGKNVPFIEKVFKSGSVGKFNLLNLEGSITIEKSLKHDGATSDEDNELSITGTASGSIGVSLGKINTNPATGKETFVTQSKLLDANRNINGFIGLSYRQDPFHGGPVTKGVINYGYSSTSKQGVLVFQEETDLTITNSFEIGPRAIDFLKKKNVFKSTVKDILLGIGSNVVFPNQNTSITNTVIDEVNKTNKLILEEYDPRWNIGELSFTTNRTYKVSDYIDLHLPFTDGKAGLLKLGTYAQADFPFKEKKAHPETKSLLPTIEYSETNKFVKIQSPILTALNALEDAFKAALPRIIAAACGPFKGFCNKVVVLVGDVVGGVVSVFNSIRSYSPFLKAYDQLEERGRVDFSVLNFSIPEGGKSFPIKTKINLEYYYPGGEVKAVTTNKDTLVIISDIFFLSAILNSDTFRTSANGDFNIKAYLGEDDLTFYGFEKTSDVALLHQYAGDTTWQVIGRVSRLNNNISFPFNKTGTFALGRLLPNNDRVPPKIDVQTDKITNVGDFIYATITDLSGINWGSVKVSLEGSLIPFVRVGNTNQIKIPTDSLTSTILKNIFLSIQARDLVGNLGYEVVILNEATTASQEVIIHKQLLQLSPNPTSDQLNIIWQWHQQQNLSFEIYDISGRRVKELVVISNGDQLQTTEIPIHNLSSGVYLLTIKDKGKVLDSRQFVKL